MSVNVDTAANHPLQPSDIEARHQIPGFGKAEIETAAGIMLRFFQSRGNWDSFRLGELLEFCQQYREDPGQALFGLFSYWYDDSLCAGGVTEPKPFFVMFSNGTITPTTLFVNTLAGRTTFRRNPAR